MGLAFDFVKGEGPGDRATRCAAPPTSSGCSAFEPREALAHVLEAIRQMRRELAGRVPLIGFAGAPFTLAVVRDRRRPLEQLTRTPRR